MKKRFLLALFLVFVMLFAFTACDDDDSKTASETQIDIISAMGEAADDAIDYASAENGTYTISSHSYSYDTIYSDETWKVVVSGTVTITDSTDIYDLTGTVDGVSHTLYFKTNYSGSYTLKLDGKSLKIDY